MSMCKFQTRTSYDFLACRKHLESRTGPVRVPILVPHGLAGLFGPLGPICVPHGPRTARTTDSRVFARSHGNRKGL